METKQERRNRLYRERYAKNEAMRNRYQVKARAAIPERNEKRKVVVREKAKEDGYIFCGSKKYNINALILESYQQERIAILRSSSDSMFWKTAEGREYAAQCRRKKPLTRIKLNFRNRFNKKFRFYRRTKKDSISVVLGCSWSFFASWLQSKFTKKMKWNNYGSYWHIDHIEPLASFDNNNDEHIRRAWHYTNLRPLEAKENKQKSDKIIIHQPELTMVIY